MLMDGGGGGPGSRACSRRRRGDLDRRSSRVGGRLLVLAALAGEVLGRAPALRSGSAKPAASAYTSTLGRPTPPPLKL